MRVGHCSQLVPVVLDRLMVVGLSEFDRQQVFRHGAAMHHDIGKHRFAAVVVGRDDRSPWAAAAAVRRAGCSRNRRPSRRTDFRDAPPGDASACARRDPCQTDGSRARRTHPARRTIFSSSACIVACMPAPPECLHGRRLILTRFLHANRFPPTDQVRGHASLENALLTPSRLRSAAVPFLSPRPPAP